MSDSSFHTFLYYLDKKLWTAADRLRSNLDATVYKHAVLGLIFLQAEIETMLSDTNLPSI